MNCLIFSDIQASGSDSSYAVLNYGSHLSCVYNSLMWVADICKEIKPDFAVCLGDVGHFHSMIEIPANNATFFGMQAIARHTPLHILSGNHDLDSRDQKSSYVDALSTIDNVCIYKESCKKHIGGIDFTFMPFNNNNSDSQLLNVPISKFGFFHCALEGFPLAPGVLDKGLNKDFLSKFTTIFNGHYHDPCNFGNVYIVGSFMYHDFNDNCLTARDRGVCLVDFDKQDFKSICNPITPYYITVKDRKSLDSYTGDKSRTFVKLAYDEPLINDLSGFVGVTKAFKNVKKDIRRSNINVNTAPSESLGEYGKLNNLTKEEIEYGVNILRDIKLSDFKSNFNIEFLDSRVRNFLGVSSSDLNYDNIGLCYVQGVNKDESSSESSGAGKSSSLIEPIIWAFWDTTIRGLKSDNILNDSLKKDCYVYQKYRVLNDVFEIIRTRALSKTSVEYSGGVVELSGNCVVLYKNGVSVGKYTMEETNNLIQETHGISFNAFVSILFMGSSLQGDYVSFTKLGPYDRVAFIESFMKWLEIYPKAYDKISGIRTDLNKELDLLNSKIPLLNNQVDKNKSLLIGLTESYNNFEDKKKTTIDEISGKIASVKLDIDNNNITLTSLNQDLSVIQEKSNSLPKTTVVSNLIDTLKESLYSYRSDMKNCNSDLATLVLSSCPTCKQNIPDEYKKTFKSNVESKIKELKSLESSVLLKISESNEDLRILNENKSKFDDLIREQKSKISDTSSNIKLLEKDLESLSREFIQTNSAVNPYSDQIKNINGLISETESALSEISVAIKDKTEILRKANIWYKGFSPSGVRSLILDNVLCALNDNADSYCDKIFQGDVTVQFEPSLIRGKFSIEIKVFINKIERLYAGCSGGERRRVDLVCSLAFRDFVLNLTNSVWNLAIFDEATDALPGKPSELVVNAIKGTANNIIVISHNPFIKALFSKCITVTKNMGSVTVNFANEN